MNQPFQNVFDEDIFVTSENRYALYALFCRKENFRFLQRRKDEK